MNWQTAIPLKPCLFKRQREGMGVIDEEGAIVHPFCTTLRQKSGHQIQVFSHPIAFRIRLDIGTKSLAGWAIQNE